MKHLEAYTQYHSVQNEYVQQLPEGWELWKISHAFSLIGSGTTPQTGNTAFYIDGTVNWINTGDLNDGVLEYCKNKVTEEAIKKHSVLKIYPKGTLLIAMYGATIGKAAITNIEACTNQACCALSKSKILNNKYTLYWFIANRQNIVNLSYGGGQPNISQDVIKKLKIPVPPLETQNAIVDYLDRKNAEIDAFITKKQRLIELLGERKKRVINHAITKGIDNNTLKKTGIEWISEISTDFDLKPFFTLFKKISIKNDKKRAYPILSLSYGNIIEKDISSNFGLQPTNYDSYQILSKDDIVFRFTDLQNDQKSLRVGLAKFTGIITSAYLAARIKNLDTLNPLYAYYLLHTYDLEKVFYSFGGGVRQAMDFSDIKWLPIVLPTLKKQKQIVEHIQKISAEIDTAISKAEKEIAAIQEYRQALITALVTGKYQVPQLQTATA